MHGHERCPEDRSNDHYQLHARLHAIKREDARGILESSKPEVISCSFSVRRRYMCWILHLRGVVGAYSLLHDQVLAERVESHRFHLTSFLECTVAFQQAY